MTASSGGGTGSGWSAAPMSPELRPPGAGPRPYTACGWSTWPVTTLGRGVGGGARAGAQRFCPGGRLSPARGRAGPAACCDHVLLRGGGPGRGCRPGGLMSRPGQSPAAAAGGPAGWRCRRPAAWSISSLS